MRQEFFDIEIATSGASLINISVSVQDMVDGFGFGDGLLTIWCRHTGASLLVQANADADVAADIMNMFDALVPKRPGAYQHRPDEDDNAPSHLRALLTQTQISIPIENGRMPLGKVQSLFLVEHRDAGRARKLRVHFIGT